MMPKKIVGFGDSFVYGNELAHNDDGDQAWPALAAKELGCEYETRAVAGCGNENIAQQIYSYFSDNPSQDTLAVINWTWSMRWDFYLMDLDQWIALGPTCVPGKIQGLVGAERAEQLVSFYHEHTGRSDTWNKFRSLQSIYAAQHWMKRHGINNVQTFMDRSMFECYRGNRVDHYAAYRDPSWPEITSESELDDLPLEIRSEVLLDYSKTAVPNFVKILQDEVYPGLESFDGRTFLEWSYHKGFTVTDLLHPLEDAHRAACELWKPRYANKLGIEQRIMHV